MDDRVQTYCRSVVLRLARIVVAGKSEQDRRTGYIDAGFQITSQRPERSAGTDKKAEFQRQQADILVRVLNAHGHETLVVVGDAGSGKSEFLNQLAWKLARYNEAADAQDDYCIPIRLHCRELNAEGTPWFESEMPWESVVRAVCAAKDPNRWLSARNLAELRDRGSLVLLIDGFDEIQSEEARHNFTRGLKNAAETGGVLDPCTIVIASRGSAAFHLVGNWLGRAPTRLDLRHFSDDDVRSYIDQFFDDSERKQWVLDQLDRSSEGVRKLLYLPLFLALF